MAWVIESAAKLNQIKQGIKDTFNETQRPGHTPTYIYDQLTGVQSEIQNLVDRDRSKPVDELYKEITGQTEEKFKQMMTNQYKTIFKRAP